MKAQSWVCLQQIRRVRPPNTLAYLMASSGRTRCMSFTQSRLDISNWRHRWMDEIFHQLGRKPHEFCLRSHFISDCAAIKTRWEEWLNQPKVMALRMLITSIFHTLKSLFWALVLPLGRTEAWIEIISCGSWAGGSWVMSKFVGEVSPDQVPRRIGTGACVVFFDMKGKQKEHYHFGGFPQTQIDCLCIEFLSLNLARACLSATASLSCLPGGKARAKSLGK